MLFTAKVLEGIVDGRIDRAFRHWPRPRVRPGGSQRTGIGVIGFESVETVEPSDLTDEDALRAGFASLYDLRRFVDRPREGSVFRIRFRLLGPDPRLALREAVPDADELAEIERRLARLDRASRHGLWTRAVLEAIQDRPGIPAAELAAGFGREKLPFKVDVRKLKELGLTESLRPGYRLSPRGHAVVERLPSKSLTSSRARRSGTRRR